MKCPNLDKWIILNRCNAAEPAHMGNNSFYIPSIFQITEYCKSRNHSKCPFYLGCNGKKGKGLVSV